MELNKLKQGLAPTLIYILHNPVSGNRRVHNHVIIRKLIMVYCDFNKLGGNLTTRSGHATQGMRYTHLLHVISY